MKVSSICKYLGSMGITGAILLMIWWGLMPVFLPVGEAEENFQNLILSAHWTPLNMVGLFGLILITLGFPGIYINRYSSFSKLGFFGLLLSTTGLILYSSIQYYETIVWPAAAKSNPELLEIDGALVSGDKTVMIGLLISGAILSLGYILFGISGLKFNAYPKLGLWFLIIGAPLFGIGVVFPIRTVGLILFGIGTIWLSDQVRKQNDKTEANKM